MSVRTSIYCDSCDWNGFSLNETSYPPTLADIKRYALAKNWTVTKDEPPKFICRDCNSRSLNVLS